MSAIRVNYTISEEAKKNTDYLKKQFKTNISELVDSLLRFDDNSMIKLFECYKLMNPDKIDNYTRLYSKDVVIVWDEKLKEIINKLPLSNIDPTKYNDIVMAIAESNYMTNEEEAEKTFVKIEKLTEVALDSYSEVSKFRKKLEILEKEVAKLKKNPTNPHN